MVYFHAVQHFHDVRFYRIAHTSTENASNGQPKKHPGIQLELGLLNIKWPLWGSIVASETRRHLEVFPYFLEFELRKLVWYFIVITHDAGKLCGLSYCNPLWQTIPSCYHYGMCASHVTTMLTGWISILHVYPLCLVWGGSMASCQAKGVTDRYVISCLEEFITQKS